MPAKDDPPGGYQEISDYGVIGNLSTCALVGRDGSIDWCCFPHLDSPSVFAAILDAEKGGRFRVRPSGAYTSSRRYLEDTNVLETSFDTGSGLLVLTDFLPAADLGETSDGRQTGGTPRSVWTRETAQEEETPLALYRRARCVAGRVEAELDLHPRFDYARVPARISRRDGLPVFEGQGERAHLWLSSAIGFSEVQEGRIRGSFALHEGEELWLVLSYGRKLGLTPRACEETLKRTIDYWRSWVHRCDREGCVFDGPWHDLVVRSGLALKLLTHPHTGAVAAAVTSSLPEVIGGARNWDYRYAWVRDASFTVQALFNMGHIEEARGFLDWCGRIFTHEPDPARLRVLYSLHDGGDVTERVLDHLEGYRGSRPVRVGNAAAGQLQLDIYGELLDVAYRTSHYGKGLPEGAWPYLRSIVDHVCGVWREKDCGIWEVRGEPRHFVYSKAMCWVALDRGLRIARARNWSGDIARWRTAAAEIRETVLTEGYSEERGSFVQSFGSKNLDAANLLLPMVGLLPFDDPRVRSTIDVTLRELVSGGLVRRYQGADGLEGEEGAFLLCTFWLVDTLALSGRTREAEEIFLEAIGRASPLGLLSEEVDPATGGLLGNFPQAFSHIGLINSALYLGKASGKMQMGPEPLGL